MSWRPQKKYRPTDVQTCTGRASTYTYINVQTCTGQYVHVHTGTYAYMLFLTLLKKCKQVVYTVYTTVVHGISKGHFLYAWYIALYAKSDSDIMLYTMYIDKRCILCFPMYILCFSMYILCFPLFFSGSKQCIYMDDHGILHCMTCSSAAVWVPAAAASCALLAHLNAAHLLPA